MSDAKKFTYEEVAKHKKEGDVWLIIRKKVYDITKFIEQHPGGGEVLLDVAGRDATQDFDDVGHSEEANKLMADYYIGELDGSAPSEKKVEQVAAQKKTVESTQQQQQQTSGSSSLTYIIPIAVLAVSLLAYFIVRN